MIRSYHEGNAREGEAEKCIGVDSDCASIAAGQQANCLNPIQLLSWMRKKLVNSFSLNKLREASANSTSMLASTSASSKLGSQHWSSTLVARTDGRYSEVQVANTSFDDEEVQEDVIEPVYEVCPLALSAPKSFCQYQSQFSDTSAATNCTQQTSTTRTSGVYSLADESSDKSPADGECNSSSNSNSNSRTEFRMPNSVSVATELVVCSSGVYSTVRRRCFPPPLPAQRHYRQAEVETLKLDSLVTQDDGNVCMDDYSEDGSNSESEAIGATGDLRDYFSPLDSVQSEKIPRKATAILINDDSAADLRELENIYESIDKLQPLPSSKSSSSLARGQLKLNAFKSRLQAEIEKLHYIDSPSTSMMSLDCRIHGAASALGKLNNCRRMVVDTTVPSTATQSTVFAVL